MLHERPSKITESELDLDSLSPKVRRAVEGRRRESTGMGHLNAFNSYAFDGRSKDDASSGPGGS